MQQFWRLINKESGDSIAYSEFEKLEIDSKQLLTLSLDKKYKIEYLEDDKLIEIVKMSDYFNY